MLWLSGRSARREEQCQDLRERGRVSIHPAVALLEDQPCCQCERLILRVRVCQIAAKDEHTLARRTSSA